MNILLNIAYKGTEYHGFQVQENALAVCEVLQNSIQSVFGARPDVKGCSRTDSGVHALNFGLNFHFETNLPDEKIPLALNNYLPDDIRVKYARRVPEDFHARYSALGKEYRYVILNSPVDDPFQKDLYYRLPRQLDIELMNRAAEYIKGRQDFAAFMSAGSAVEDTIRNVTSLNVCREEKRVVITISADGFLYNMVRIIAGTLVMAGEEKIKPEQTAEIIASKNRANAGDTMAAKGLFLSRVFYKDFILE